MNEVLLAIVKEQTENQLSEGDLTFTNCFWNKTSSECKILLTAEEKSQTVVVSVFNPIFSPISRVLQFKVPNA
jgi:hypothetical protein